LDSYSRENTALILVTPRLALRDARLDDVTELAAYQRDPLYLEHYGDRVDADEIIRLASQWAAESPRLNYQLIVTLAANGTVVGCTGLRQAGYPSGEAEVGIELSPLHWGTGYASESLAELIRFGRHELGLARFWAITSPANHRAHRLLERMGFSPEPSSSASSLLFSFRPGAWEGP
jgi:ribosomal-protein-alanine N-acetyltransferase